MRIFSSLFKGNRNTKHKLSQELRAINSSTFNEEFAADLSSGNYTNYNTPYSANGIQLEKNQKTLKLVYNGILAKSGAQDVYTVIGYGNNLKWENTKQYLMQRVGNNSFELSIPTNTSDNINLVFKDCANNWDNNSGSNYSFTS